MDASNGIWLPVERQRYSVRRAQRHRGEAARRAGLPLNEWLNASSCNTRPDSSLTRRLRAATTAPMPIRIPELIRKIIRSASAARQSRASHRSEECAGGRLTRQDPAVRTPTRSPSRSAASSSSSISLRRRAHPQRRRPCRMRKAPHGLAPRERAYCCGMLNGEAAPAAPAPAPAPTQDLSGLENELRRITNQVPTLRQPGVEEAINSALRANSARSDVITLNDAMPRRASKPLKNKSRQIPNQRIAEGRVQAGINSSALEGIECGLAEVRNASIPT